MTQERIPNNQTREDQQKRVANKLGNLAKNPENQIDAWNTSGEIIRVTEEIVGEVLTRVDQGVAYARTAATDSGRSADLAQDYRDSASGSEISAWDAAKNSYIDAERAEAAQKVTREHVSRANSFMDKSRNNATSAEKSADDAQTAKTAVDETARRASQDREAAEKAKTGAEEARDEAKKIEEAGRIPGPKGDPGIAGKSAYQLAVDAAGFKEDEVAWLASLKGEKGADGSIGPMGPAGTVDTSEVERLTRIAADAAEKSLSLSRLSAGRAEASRRNAARSEAGAERAETARAGAETAKTGAETAKTGVETAKSLIDTRLQEVEDKITGAKGAIIEEAVKQVEKTTDGPIADINKTAEQVKQDAATAKGHADRAETAQEGAKKAEGSAETHATDAAEAALQTALDKEATGRDRADVGRLIATGLKSVTDQVVKGVEIKGGIDAAKEDVDQKTIRVATMLGEVTGLAGQVRTDRNFVRDGVTRVEAAETRIANSERNAAGSASAAATSERNAATALANARIAIQEQEGKNQELESRNRKRFFRALALGGVGFATGVAAIILFLTHDHEPTTQQPPTIPQSGGIFIPEGADVEINAEKIILP